MLGRTKIISHSQRLLACSYVLILAAGKNWLYRNRVRIKFPLIPYLKAENSFMLCFSLFFPLSGKANYSSYTARSFLLGCLHETSQRTRILESFSIFRIALQTSQVPFLKAAIIAILWPQKSYERNTQKNWIGILYVAFTFTVI